MVFFHHKLLDPAGMVVRPFELVHDGFVVKAHFDLFLDFIGKLFDDPVVGWLLIKLQSQNLLKHIAQRLLRYSKYFFGVFDF